MEFGREVRRRREQAGLTLEALAEKAQLSPNFVGAVENGRKDPSLSTIKKLAKGLRVGPGELLGGVEGLSSAALEGARLFDEVPPQVRDAALQLLRTVRRRR